MRKETQRLGWRRLLSLFQLVVYGLVVKAYLPQQTHRPYKLSERASQLGYNTVTRTQRGVGALSAKKTMVDVEVKSLSATDTPANLSDGFKHASNIEYVNEDYGPYMKLGKFKINAFGAYFMAETIVFGMIWAAALGILYLLIKVGFDKLDPTRKVVDYTSGTWGWASMAASDTLPEITGLENMPDGPAVYCANHASWMDVPSVALVPHNCKYFAKSDLAKVPILGWALRLARHVLLDREDKKSQLEALRKSLDYLKDGSSVFVFPEGTRSRDGRLGEFKLGAFRVATKANVPIVPMSISGTQIIMPPSVIMPQRHATARNGGRIMQVHIHKPIDVTGLSDKEAAQRVYGVINDALPPEQKGSQSFD